VTRLICLSLLAIAFSAEAAEPPLIRLGRGFAAEEQVWLMSARPDLTPNQGKRYQLKQILFQANPERFQAFLAGELDAGTAPGLAVIFARAQGMDMTIVANVCLEAAGKEYFQTTYMVKDDGPIKTVKDLKGGTIGVAVWETESTCEVLVADSGPGVPQDRVERIFEPYQRPFSDLLRSYRTYGPGNVFFSLLSVPYNDNVVQDSAQLFQGDRKIGAPFDSNLQT